MKQPATKHLKKKSKSLKILLLIGLPALLLAWFGYSAYQYFTINYAQRAAGPVEEALVLAGAKRLCTTGSAGRGPSSQSPWYGAEFEIKDNIDHVKGTVRGAMSKDSGLVVSDFTFNQQNQSWDILGTMPSPYEKLEEGDAVIEVHIETQRHFNPTKDEKYCTLSDGAASPGTLILNLSVHLPSYK